MSSSNEPVSSSIDGSGRQFFKDDGRSPLSSTKPHCKFFAWLDDYVASFEEFSRNSPDIEGWTRDQSQIRDAAGVDAGKLRELEARVSGLELEAKNCNANSGSSGGSVKAFVIAFVFGIVISKFF
ncbi:hypothetical protein AHAS_Ahas04G0212300 [Arachis hypogaea]